MECLRESIVLDLVEGRLEASAAGEAEQHLGDCPACRSLVHELESGASTGSAWLDALGVESSDSGAPWALTLEPGAAVGPYVLERELGRGGMGVVWAASLRGTGDRVALKLLGSAAPERVRRFVREARIGVALDHPNIVRVRELVTLPGSGAPLLVMELLDGESLAARLRRGPLAEGDALDLARALVAALEHAHANGVVHRDLKPDNVFLVGGPAPVVKVLDFGVAKLLGAAFPGPRSGASATRAGALVGTPHYMAPEQLFGDRPVDARADVWALGAVLYESITGKRPVDGDTFGQICERVALGRIAPLSSLAPATSPALAAAVTQMLARDPAHRPALSAIAAALDGQAHPDLVVTAGAHDALAPTLAHEPVAVSAATSPDTAAGAPGRGRRVALGVCAAALVLVGVAALGSRSGTAADSVESASALPGAAAPPLIGAPEVAGTPSPPGASAPAVTPRASAPAVTATESPSAGAAVAPAPRSVPPARSATASTPGAAASRGAPPEAVAPRSPGVAGPRAGRLDEGDF